MKKFPIHRTRVGRDIVAEFAVPPTKKLRKSNRVAILAGGMPSKSSKASFMEYLAREGFWVIFPQYRGTWESDGEFLKKEPTDDILFVMNHLKKPLVSLWEEKKYTLPPNPEFYIFAGSFGGPAGILLSKDPRVNAVIAVAPVVDWSIMHTSKAEPIDLLYGVVKQAYGKGYRMKKRNWDKLGKTSFYDPTKQLDKIVGAKILIFHSKDDESVPYASVKRFAKKVGATFYLQTRGGHIGMAEIIRPLHWRRVKKFLDDRSKR